MSTEQVKLPELIEQVKSRLIEMRYSQASLNAYNNTWNKLINYADKRNVKYYSTSFGLEFAKECYGILLEEEAVKAKNHKNKLVLRHLRVLSDYQLHKTILRAKKHISSGFPRQFDKLFSAYLDKYRLTVSESTVNRVSIDLRMFANYLSNNNVKNFKNVTVNHIHGFIASIQPFSSKTKYDLLTRLRLICKYAYENGHNAVDLSPVVSKMRFVKDKRLPSTYTPDEIERLIAAVDRGSPVGKRDYCVLLLAARLGLRVSDIVDLTFDSFKWDKDIIAITQRKTGVTNTLPLLKDVGEAVIDYLRYGRPQSGSSNIFVRHLAPFEAFESVSGLYNIMEKYLIKANIDTAPNKHRGLHSLRHSLATTLLEDNIPLAVISGILGTLDVKNTDMYMRKNIDELRKCALEVSL
jgi:site-specific recombinase XerD